MIGKVILVTAASNEIGRLAANALSHSGHTVFAALPNTSRDAHRITEINEYAEENGVDLHALSMDTGEPCSISRAIEEILNLRGRLDVVVHTNHDVAFGPAEAFTPDQFADIFDRIVLSAQRVNREALPHMRHQGEGLLVWVSSSSSAGGVFPYLSPYVVAKAALDALAVQYARELSSWGIETTIVVAGTQLHNSSLLLNAEGPYDGLCATEYEDGFPDGSASQVRQIIDRFTSANPDIGPIAGAIVEAVDTPFGFRPFRIHVDPAQDGGAVAFTVIDRVRDELLHRVKLPLFIKPRQRQKSLNGRKN